MTTVNKRLTLHMLQDGLPIEGYKPKLVNFKIHNKSKTLESIQPIQTGIVLGSPGGIHFEIKGVNSKVWAVGQLDGKIHKMHPQDPSKFQLQPFMLRERLLGYIDEGDIEAKDLEIPEYLDKSNPPRERHIMEEPQHITIDIGKMFTDKENVNHPSHYNQYPIEVIDMMVGIWGKEKVIEFCYMNAFKYRMRLGLKDDINQDLAKEIWYLNKAKTLKDELN